MKKKIIIVSILIVIAVAIFGTWFFGRMEYNDQHAVGNTAGNLYNGGLFCESDGKVYFSNPYDKDSLYVMDVDGSNVKKIYNDKVSYINVYNDYIYYERFNHESSVEVVFRGALYGLFRIQEGDSKAEALHTGIVDNVALSGNYLYFRSYDDKNLYQLYKVGIDGDDEIKISDRGYTPISISSGNIFFIEVDGNHNIMRLNTENDEITQYKTGNFYMPIVCNNYMYYIDLDNNRALSRMNMATEEKEVLSSDKVVNYNLSEDSNVIFYQAENSLDDHKLVRMDLNGENAIDVVLGDCFNISITSTYTYYITKIEDTKLLFRVSTNGIAIPELFEPKEK